MKAAYKWILNNRYVAYITDEDGAASFIMDTVLIRGYYSDGTERASQVIEPDVILSLNHLTEEEYKNNYNSLKLFYETSGETIGITSDYIFPDSYSEFYSNNTFYCKEEGTDFSITASGETLEYGAAPTIVVETDGISSSQNISLGFGLPKGPQGLSGETMNIALRARTLEPGQEEYVNTIEGENSTYILDFGLTRGPQGSIGAQGRHGYDGEIGTEMEVRLSGTTGNSVGVTQTATTGATGYYYNLGFTLKQGDQGEHGDGNASAETISREDFCELMANDEVEEKIYVVDEGDDTYSLYFGATLIYGIDYCCDDDCECDCDYCDCDCDEEPKPCPADEECCEGGDEGEECYEEE